MNNHRTKKQAKTAKVSKKGAKDVKMTKKHPALASNTTNHLVVNIKKKGETYRLFRTRLLDLVFSLLNSILI